MTSFSGMPHTGEIIRFGPRQAARALKSDAFAKWPRKKQRALANWRAIEPQLLAIKLEWLGTPKTRNWQGKPSRLGREKGFHREGSQLCACGARISANKSEYFACSKKVSA